MLLKSFKDGKNHNFLNAKLRLEWTIEFFDGLSYVHKNKICHRDLKPSNLFLFKNKSKIYQMSIKIGDFGLSKEISDSFVDTPNVGTYHYQSPEIVKKEQYSFKTDVW